MLRSYEFVVGKDGPRPFRYIGLAVLSGVLAWKLLRAILIHPLTWHLHIVFLGVLASSSFLILARGRFRLRTYDMSVAIFLFCAIAVARVVAFATYQDAFTTAILAFFAHLFLASVLVRVTDREFFRSISFIFTCLVLIEILGIIEYAYDWKVVDYAGIEAIEGVAPVEGRYGGRSFILLLLDLEILRVFWGRLSGISGTPYATGGLMSAIAAFALASKRWALAALAMVAILLSSTGSAVLALYLGAAIIYRKNPLMYVPLLLVLPFLTWVMVRKGFGAEELIPSSYLAIDMDASAFEAIAMVILGEGRHTSSLATEFRIFGSLLSLGVVGVASLVWIFDRFRQSVRLPSRPEIRREYRAAGYFILTLFFSTLHYNTFFIYPNILFVVVFLALASSRFRISRAASEVRAGGQVAV